MLHVVVRALVLARESVVLHLAVTWLGVVAGKACSTTLCGPPTIPVNELASHKAGSDPRVVASAVFGTVGRLPTQALDRRPWLRRSRCTFRWRARPLRRQGCYGGSVLARVLLGVADSSASPLLSVTIFWVELQCLTR